MATTAFQFVQGNERLDWGILVSIDVERLMKSTNVGTLQRIIENIAFSRVTRDEAALLTPDHILHLFQLCQVVIQYLVYSQEILANINVKLNDRMEGQQATAHEREMLLQRLSDETALLKKQAKTQRRTLLAYEYNVHAALARGVTGSGAAAAAAAPGVPATLYICPYCGDEYHKAESMQSHLRKRHNTTAGSTNSPVAGTATPPPLPIAGGGGGGPTYGNHPASSIPPAAGGCIAAAGDAETLQQLRHRVEQLERDKEVMERQQRENLILMMLGASRSQPTSPPPQQQEQKPASAPSSTSLHPLVSPSLPPPSPLSSATAAPSATTTESAVNTIPEHLRGVPVVPDISAMMNYNLSCQREASENALRRQLVSLEAEIRALRASKSSAASTVLSEAPPPPPQSTPGPCITASTGIPAGAWPAWVAELENAQQRQHQQQQQSTTTEAVPSLTPPSTPPPAPLLPPPPQQQQQRDYTTGVTAPSPVSPPSHSQSSSTQPASTSPAAPLIQAMPSLTAQSPLRSSSLAPQPSYGIQQQQQQQHPPAVQPSTPSAPGLSTAVIPIPSPTTAAITEAGAPAAPTPTPSVSIPQPLVVHPKPHHGVESSTNSSLTSTSTLPPHRAVSKGPPGISLSHISATPWTLSTLTSTGVLGGAALATAAATSTSVAPIPLPSTTSTGLLAPPVSSPGLGVGSYFSSRTSVPAAATPALLPITPPPAARDSSSPTQQYSYTAPLSTVSPSVSSTHNSPPPSATVPEPSVPHPTSVQPLRMTNTPLSHAPPLPVPVVAGSTSGNTTSVNSWSLPAPVPSIATVPVPAPAAVSGAVKPFRTLSSSSSSSSGSRFGAAGRYEY